MMMMMMKTLSIFHIYPEVFTLNVILQENGDITNVRILSNEKKRKMRECPG
jgi:hypothetical protein